MMIGTRHDYRGWTVQVTEYLGGELLKVRKVDESGEAVGPGFATRMRDLKPLRGQILSGDKEPRKEES